MNKKELSEVRSKAGKEGSEARWRVRWDTLAELYDLMPHEVYSRITHARTEYLQILRNAYKHEKSKTKS